MEIAPTEIFDLITTERNTKENKRMFDLYNHMTGRKVKPCRCASKVQMIKQYLSDWLKENNFING